MKPMDLVGSEFTLAHHRLAVIGLGYLGRPLAVAHRQLKDMGAAAIRGFYKETHALSHGAGEATLWHVHAHQCGAIRP